MLFSSPEFLFAFLPGFLLAYFATPWKFKNALLLAASLFFYFTTSGELTVILIGSVLFNHYLARFLQLNNPRLRRLLLVFGVAVNLAPLIYYKYARFFLAGFGDAFQAIGLRYQLPTVNPILPIGISFFTFQAISYLVDIYSRRTTPAEHVIDFGMYHSCFPQLIAGPIVRYEEIETQVTNRVLTRTDVFNGIVQFCFGLGKKVILADTMGIVANRLFAVPAHELSQAGAWVGLIAYTLQIYFDFSGYSDMAIGLGRVLGFSYPENFDQPYRCLSITEFWRRWHMTLSRWFRDYVYIPLGGNRQGTGRTLFNLFLVFFLCGLWHGAAYTFIVWGLYHGMLLVAERVLSRHVRFEFPIWLRWCYTFGAVMVGWVFFRTETLGSAFAFLSAMFRFGATSAPDPALASALSFDKIFFMLIGLGCSLIPYRAVVGTCENRYNFRPLAGACALLTAILAVILMSVNGFSPFIYFRF